MYRDPYTIQQVFKNGNQPHLLCQPPNLVRLLGCSMESGDQSRLQFMPNGTLSTLQNRGAPPPLACPPQYPPSKPLMHRSSPFCHYLRSPQNIKSSNNDLI
ncbi:hypothetical protein SDJN03_08200, partial [Cucurbita argyrosperma subsp. sororia]